MARDSSAERHFCSLLHLFPEIRGEPPSWPARWKEGTAFDDRPDRAGEQHGYAGCRLLPGLRTRSRVAIGVAREREAPGDCIVCASRFTPEPPSVVVVPRHAQRQC